MYNKILSFLKSYDKKTRELLSKVIVDKIPDLKDIDEVCQFLDKLDEKLLEESLPAVTSLD